MKTHAEVGHLVDLSAGRQRQRTPQPVVYILKLGIRQRRQVHRLSEVVPLLKAGEHILFEHQHIFLAKERRQRLGRANDLRLADRLAKDADECLLALLGHSLAGAAVVRQPPLERVNSVGGLGYHLRVLAPAAGWELALTHDYTRTHTSWQARNTAIPARPASSVPMTCNRFQPLAGPAKRRN